MKKKVLMGYIKTKEDFIKLGKVMKANAPEKIYMTPSFGEPDNVLLASFSKSHLNFHRDVEYTRTDIFIDKAEEFFYSALNDGIMGTCDIENFIRLFKNHIKGE